MMFSSRRSGLAAVLTLMVALPVMASAAAETGTTKKNTVMTVGEMCGGCVKKITKRFDGIKGIAGVKCSIEHNTVTVVPDANVRLSPRGVWAIMEGIGKTPKKMVCPLGTYTSKPPR